MDAQVDGAGVRFKMAGPLNEWEPMREGVILSAGRDLEFFIPAEDVIEHGADLLRANVEGLACSFDLRRYGVATITDDGSFFILRHDARHVVLRHLPLL